MYVRTVLHNPNSGPSLDFASISTGISSVAATVRLAPPSDHIRRLEVQSARLSQLPNADPGVIVCLSLSKTTKNINNEKKQTNNCATTNSGTTVDGMVLEHHDSRRPPPCSRINSCSGVIVPSQQGLHTAVCCVSKMTLSPVHMNWAHNSLF